MNAIVTFLCYVFGVILGTAWLISAVMDKKMIPSDQTLGKSLKVSFGFWVGMLFAAFVMLQILGLIFDFYLKGG